MVGGVHQKQKNVTDIVNEVEADRKIMGKCRRCMDGHDKWLWDQNQRNWGDKMRLPE